ncbi:biotin--[acetyl-CoA-carboxylase] ligase [Olivibacter sp. SDN3]|uniref:biotin--[acetyl-CoA-carboxylase] ligase n=1 Tax=Olivibacter sp. SDN3 TaxID=2764720 RepID=UPI0016513E70|nr:biotin--[acetyl-CoA-carboxylase] ligase [Olivibacter sp. SDN3]QNL50806.1 biotin--[acetyl-CoA-carboxylase] ligase [Olivibacter sp. SDN3]
MNSFSSNVNKTLQSNTFLGLIVGENVITLQRVNSTNDYLKSKLSNSTPYQEGTVIMAVEQYAGKGQAGNTWVSEAGQNLTLSILLNPTFLLPKEQFRLNIAISLAIIECIKPILGESVRIKWPNDIYVNNKKIGGILIENIIRGSKWKHAIIGIALNVNQTSFGIQKTKACSLKKLLNKDFDLHKLLKLLCAAVSKQYHVLKKGGHLLQRELYKQCLFRFNTPSSFLIDGVQVIGTITDVDDQGKLIIDFDGHLTKFCIKEISFVI